MAGRINRIIVDLIIGGLRRFAPDALPPEAELAALAGDDTGVPLEPYRAVLDQVYARGGGASILRAGRALDDLSDPLLFVLLNSDRPSLVIEKEARLGRFIHSRHVVRVLEERADGLVLEHASLESEPPRDTEDLAACGQHIALFEQVGCRGVTLRFPASADPELAAYADGDYREPATGGGYQVWAFAWQSFAPTRRPMPGLDEVLLAGEERPELAETPPTTAAVEAIARADLGRTWTVAEVAERLDSSPRSLQRALAGEGTRFSELLDRVRVDEARRLLDHTELTVTEIGYVCGFADTSHFSRRFKQRVGASPSAYRGR